MCVTRGDGLSSIAIVIVASLLLSRLLHEKLLVALSIDLLGVTVAFRASYLGQVQVLLLLVGTDTHWLIYGPVVSVVRRTLILVVASVLVILVGLCLMPIMILLPVVNYWRQVSIRFVVCPEIGLLSG